jgi:transcriptional regulator with XRE-family HTH domain
MTDNERKEFGAYMARLREASGLSLREVAAKVGMSNTYIFQIEKGERNPPVTEKLYVLADLYGVPRESMLAAAHRTAESNRKQYFEALDNAFHFVTNHPGFVYGNQIPSASLTPAAKRFIVEMFEKSTGLNVLMEMEREELKRELDKEGPGR